MALKTYNPTTPGQRQLVMVDRSALYKGKPVKTLTEGKQSSGGRNNTGRQGERFSRGGHQKDYHNLDFKRTQSDKPAPGEGREKEPKPTPFISPGKNTNSTPAHIHA